MKNCLSQFLERSRTESHSAVTNLYKNILEHSISCVITQIRNYFIYLLIEVSRALSLMYIRARVFAVERDWLYMKKLSAVKWLSYIPEMN